MQCHLVVAILAIPQLFLVLYHSYAPKSLQVEQSNALPAEQLAIAREIRDVPRILGLFNILVQKIQSLLFDDFPTPNHGFACRRGRDFHFLRYPDCAHP